MISKDLENQIWDKQGRVNIDEKIIENIIEWFENIKTRPQMFYGKNDPKLVENGMYWFRMAFVHLGYISPSRNEMVKRKLNQGAKNLETQLRERGLSEEEIVSEIIDIEIEDWKQFLKEFRANK